MFLEWENNSGKLQISGAFQNNAINDVKQISVRHVIIYFSKSCYEASGELRVEICETASSRVAQRWPWSSQVTVKKMSKVPGPGF